jgi:cytidylate kinase
MSFIVAIDGPAGAGKSTVARLVANQLEMALVDTGAIYRCVALRSLRECVAADDSPRLALIAGQIRIEFQRQGDGQQVVCDGEDVTQAIRSPEVTRASSAVASRPDVRQALLELQRRLGREAPKGAVLEGRDIGTVVFPAANAKFFLTASPEERARRRFEELTAKGVQTTYESVLTDQLARDRDDETRLVAPLKPAADAVRLDTTGLAVDQIVERIVAFVRHRMT